MKKPSFISFNGIDDSTDIDILSNLYKQYPNIFFGISLDYQNQTFSLSCKLAHAKQNPILPWVLHINEKAVNKITNDGVPNDLTSVPWKKIQYNVDWYTLRCNRATIGYLQRITKTIFKTSRTILNDNVVSREVLSQIGLGNDYEILCDISGGKGIQPTKNHNWVKPYHKHFSYAGGVGFNNIHSSINCINQLINKNNCYGIDMQSSLKNPITMNFDTTIVSNILNYLSHKDSNY